MIRNLIASALLALAVAFPAGAERTAQKQHTHHASRAVSARQAADEAEMHYASISHTNPFEIVPAAGMELLDDGILSAGEADPQMVSDMLGFARKFMGTRYVRGGKSPKGFDCSGFTSYVFGQFGVELSPSSAVQYGQGSKIARDEVCAGDLLFFKGRNSRSSRVGHVAIAIDNDPATGEITFIHAAVGGGIRIDRLSGAYYASRYLGARRVL